MVSPVSSGPTAAKILVTGGFGVGKTTLVTTISEIPPLTTEAVMTVAGDEIDDITDIESKATTTVALDFGRITLESANVLLYLFGTPGQKRFWFMWDELARGAIGAVVLVDTRRITESFAAIDSLEDRKVPFLVAVNQFADAPVYPIEDVANAANISAEHPVVRCDARVRASALEVLTRLTRHALQVAV